MTIASLFDQSPAPEPPQELVAARARARGIDQADRNMPPLWRAAAENAIAWVARMRITFTADDVVERLEAQRLPDGVNPAALGPVFKHMAALGLIEKTGRYVPSRIARRHRDLVEWRAKKEADR